MTAPTEAEIREAVTIARDSSPEIDIGQWVHDLGAPLSYVPPSERGSAPERGLWTDLRASEEARLGDLFEDIYTMANAIEADAIKRITEALVAAALRFAAEFPDAPRAAREPVPA